MKHPLATIACIQADYMYGVPNQETLGLVVRNKSALTSDNVGHYV
jgi:hypothetical protein